MKSDYNRLLLIAVADALIALILAIIVLVMIVFSDSDNPAELDTSPTPGVTTPAGRATTPPSYTTPPATVTTPPVEATTPPAGTTAPEQAPTTAVTTPPAQTVSPTASAVTSSAAPASNAPEASPQVVQPEEVPRLPVAQGFSVTYLDRIESGRVTREEVNMRDAPNTSGNIIGTFDADQAVQVYGSCVTSGRTWYLVKIGEDEGFMSSSYVNLN